MRKVHFCASNKAFWHMLCMMNLGQKNMWKVLENTFHCFLVRSHKSVQHLPGVQFHHHKGSLLSWVGLSSVASLVFFLWCLSMKKTEKNYIVACYQQVIGSMLDLSSSSSSLPPSAWPDPSEETLISCPTWFLCRPAQAPSLQSEHKNVFMEQLIGAKANYGPTSKQSSKNTSSHSSSPTR